MRVMLANHDRDFLLAFTRLIEYENDEVTAVFDGTQVISKLASQQKPDIVVLDENIPRISSREILKQLNESNIPVIMISDRKINSGKLMDKMLANAYLSLPFMPSELIQLIKSVDSKHRSNEKLEYEDVSFDISVFRLCDEMRVT
ncbi:MAG: response regulator, partial [Clostridia bacterium]|nr:response regulator [Clostridia bacterium]